MQPPSDSQSNSARWLLTAAAVVSALLLLRICLAADRGFDLSDEGFNLLGMQDPSRYGLLPTLFGFVLHTIYEAVGGSIGTLRLLNFVATFGLGFFFFASLLSTTLGARLLTRSERLTTAVALSASSLALFDTWLVTPSYNGLALHGTLIAAACTLRLAGPRPWPWLLGIGFGGWLVFMAKPPASALIALMVLAHIWACSKRPWQSALVAGGFALLLLIATAFALDGSLLGFVGRLQAAAAQVAGTDHHLGALFRLGLPRMGRAQLLGAGVAVGSVGVVFGDCAIVHLGNGFLPWNSIRSSFLWNSISSSFLRNRISSPFLWNSFSSSALGFLLLLDNLGVECALCCNDISLVNDTRIRFHYVHGDSRPRKFALDVGFHVLLVFEVDAHGRGRLHGLGSLGGGLVRRGHLVLVELRNRFIYSWKAVARFNFIVLICFGL